MERTNNKPEYYNENRNFSQGVTSDRSLFAEFRGCKNSQSVAIADAYKDRREACAAMCGGKAYADFRDLLARKDIDAVVVATQDHWHVPVAVAAAKAGKDAYVEKPLGISIEQDLTCRKVFQENHRVFQYGTQQRSSGHCRLGCELVRSGRIGKVHTIEVIAPNGGAGGSTKEAPVPPNLDYDMWLGPAPKVPFTPDRCHPPGTYWIDRFLLVFAGKTNRKGLKFSKNYIEALKQHSWKGNVRELKNVVERSVILSGNNLLDIDTLPAEFHAYISNSRVGNASFSLDHSTVAEPPRFSTTQPAGARLLPHVTKDSHTA